MRGTWRCAVSSASSQPVHWGTLNRAKPSAFPLGEGLMNTSKTLQWIPVISQPTLMPERAIVNVREVAEDHVRWMRFRLACALEIGGGK